MQQQQGMTLLELLIAISILTIMTGIGFVGIHAMTVASSRIEAQQARLQKKNNAMIQITRDVNAAISSRQAISGQSDFSGQPQRFELLRFEQSLLPAVDSQTKTQNLGDVIQVSWFIRNGVLFRAQRPAAQKNNNQAWQQQSMMNVQSWGCEFLTFAGQWQPSWPTQATQNGQLPRQVKCRLTDENGDLSEWQLIPWQET